MTQRNMKRRDFLGTSVGGALTAALSVQGIAPVPARAELGSPTSQALRDGRVARLTAFVSGLPPRKICFERARLMTESYRNSVSEPAIVRKAKAFFAVADGISIDIGNDELIVGNVASKPRVAYFAPESFDWTSYRKGEVQVLSSKLLYGYDIHYRIPDDIAEFWQSMPPGDTAGHFVPDYSRVLTKGFVGIRADAERFQEAQRRDGTLDETKEAFYEAAVIATRAAERFAERHAEKTRSLAVTEATDKRRAELLQIAENCESIAAQPAQTFRQALQAFWFTHVLIHINSSEWSISPGRFDQYMWPFYERDVAEGRLTPEDARELLGCLWVKFNQIRVCAADIINYQNLMIGGVDRNGRDATNGLSYLCLETTERLKGLTQPSLSMRWHAVTPSKLLLAASHLILTGCGRPAMFSDRTIIPALEQAGVKPEDSWDYSIAGCEELAVGGKTYGMCRSGLVNQAKCVLDAIHCNPSSFDELLSEYERSLSDATRRRIEVLHERDTRSAENTPHPFVSLLFDDCLRDGRDISVGGAAYELSSISEAGTITAANSLYAVKKAVFEENRVSLPELNEALRANFKGHFALRAWLLNRVPKFGNDDDEIDQFTREIVALNQKVIDDMDVRDYRGGRIYTGSGISTAWAMGHHTEATPDGRLRGHALSVSLGPSSGTEREGPTAVLNSVAKLDWREQAGGALTHIQLPYSLKRNDDDEMKVSALISGFFRRGGMGLHFSIVDVELLKQAMKEPEKHLNVLVRMGGYSAQFVLLTSELQRDILNRTQHNL